MWEEGKVNCKLCWFCKYNCSLLTHFPLSFQCASSASFVDPSSTGTAIYFPKLCCIWLYTSFIFVCLILGMSGSCLFGFLYMYSYWNIGNQRKYTYCHWILVFMFCCSFASIVCIVRPCGRSFMIFICTRLIICWLTMVWLTLNCTCILQDKMVQKRKWDQNAQLWVRFVQRPTSQWGFSDQNNRDVKLRIIPKLFRLHFLNSLLLLPLLQVLFLFSLQIKVTASFSPVLSQTKQWNFHPALPGIRRWRRSCFLLKPGLLNWWIGRIIYRNGR